MIVPALFLAFTVQDCRAATVGDWVTVRLEAGASDWELRRRPPTIGKTVWATKPGSPTRYWLQAARPGVAVVEFRRGSDRRVIVVFIAPGKAGAK